eukprot:CAMPEP_0172464654 /NCGR_PEP_ID=MMETSP1065-20121228/51109_1 /TAXON_ID=265537 /ORGANISM="Amphiprora paludosa, Strain CCMP125" /LENGTH=44 /DNA_ID= /DNA_START= /DNA_END= /DNA_ORIENTATION=
MVEMRRRPANADDGLKNTASSRPGNRRRRPHKRQEDRNQPILST